MCRPYPILDHEVLDPLQLAHADSDPFSRRERVRLRRRKCRRESSIQVDQTLNLRRRCRAQHGFDAKPKSEQLGVAAERAIDFNPDRQAA
jgi:hypothetical protein